MKQTFRRGLAAILVTSLMLLLAACGGGTKENGGTPLPGQTVTTSHTVRVSIQDSGGRTLSTIDQGETVDVVATVVEERTTTTPGQGEHVSRKPAVGVVVTFATTGGTFTPESATAMTDGNGNAAVRLTATAAAGAYTLTASAEGANGKVNYAIGAGLDTELTVAFVDAAGRPIHTLEGGRRYTALAKAVRVQYAADGFPTGHTTPIAGAIITLASDGGIFDPANGTVLTDADGVAKAQFQATVARGGFVLSADLEAEGAQATATYEITLPYIRLGSGEPFEEGRLALGLASISAGGTTAVTGRLVREDASPFSPAVAVALSSNCVAAGQATLPESVMAANGTFTANYTAQAGCVGEDTIMARVVIPGAEIALEASAQVQVAAPTAGMIQFMDLEPGAIAVRGNGSAAMPETSRVRFRVLTGTDLPVPGKRVLFNLTTAAGGLSLESDSAVSDADGVVAANVRSGTVTTTVRVVALIEGTGLRTQSDGIVVATGPVATTGFSLSASDYNPEAWSYDGQTVTITARAADAEGNPVADGTIVQFTATGGAVTTDCRTTNGECSVVWRSQAPRPADGRATVRATVLGNANGVNATQTMTLVMATSEATVRITPDPARIEFEGAQAVEIRVSDLHGNLPPSGSTITASTSKGTLSDTSWTVGTSNALGPFVAVTTLSGNGNDVGQGRITVKVKSPKGKESTGQSVVEIAEAPPAEPDALTFVSAQPETIATRGNGSQSLPETTDVTFKVTAEGKPVAGKVVKLALTTSAGGLSLSHTQATTDGAGLVVVTVQSGTAATAFRVKATMTAEVLSAQSTELRVVAPAEPDALTFVSAQPDVIVTQGNGSPGMPEVTDVTFRLTAAGQPVVGRAIEFALTTTAGGLALDKLNATTDGSGTVVVSARSGTAATAFRVTAKLQGAALATQTKELWVVEPSP